MWGQQIIRGQMLNQEMTREGPTVVMLNEINEIAKDQADQMSRAFLLSPTLCLDWEMRKERK